MKKIILSGLSIMFSLFSFSQNRYVDTFKTRRDFEIRRYFDMDGNLFIVIDKEKWTRYECDTLPLYIKKQRILLEQSKKKKSN